MSLNVETQVDLASSHLAEVKSILRAVVPELSVWAFGSRVGGAPKQFSDLDLVLITKQPLDRHRLAQLEVAFSESSLPIKVDLVDWATISQPFRDVIKNNYAVLQLPPHD